MKPCYFLATASLLSATALTTTAGADVAVAEAMFQRGEAAMKKGDFDTACPAIEESYRLDPRIAALWTLAKCEAERGRIATSVVHYKDFLARLKRLPLDQQAQHRSREIKAEEQLTQLKPQVPMLTLLLPEGAPPDTVVMRDGVALSRAALGVALPIDPGEHTGATQVPGGPLATKPISIKKGETKTIKLDIPPPALIASSTIAEVATAAPVSGVAQPPMGSPAAERREASGATQRVVGIVLGGVGFGALSVGAFFGLKALTKHDQATDRCPSSPCSDPDGVRLNAEAYDAAKLANVTLMPGAAALAVGAILAVTAPRTPARTKAAAHSATIEPAAGADGVAVRVRGRF